MLGFTLRRLGSSLLMLVALSMFVFVLLRLTPGDPVDAYVDPQAGLSLADREVLRHRLGLDRSLPAQYVAWAGEVLRGNLGYSTQYNRIAVTTLLGARIGPTALLMGMGFAIAILLGIATGTIAAVRRNSPLDVGLAVLAFIGLSSPAFLNALLGLFVFSVWLHWAPSGGMSTPGMPQTFGGVLQHLLLPACLLALGQTALIMRYMRASLTEVLTQDYVRTARAKGVRPFWIISKHALRNAMLPVVTLIGASLGTAVGGAVFIESVFNWPGMGLMLINAVEARDYPVIMGATLLVGVCVLLANLLADLAYAAIDPRVRLA
jgi:peptide/nickel transport system permease protein